MDFILQPVMMESLTEVEARVTLICASTDDSRLLTGGTNLIWTVVDYPEKSEI